jgi:hypothetical protein
MRRPLTLIAPLLILTVTPLRTAHTNPLQIPISPQKVRTPTLPLHQIRLIITPTHPIDLHRRSHTLTLGIPQRGHRTVVAAILQVASAAFWAFFAD